MWRDHRRRRFPKAAMQTMLSTDEKGRERTRRIIRGNVLHFLRGSLSVDAILTPGSTPLPRPLSVDPPLLAHRYLPISIAGEGAFSRTILAQDILDPKEPIVAIKTMKSGFERIGQQVWTLTALAH
jgi:hypothetical protein